MLSKLLFFCAQVICGSGILGGVEPAETKLEAELKKPRKLTIISEDDLA
jgi:hypothetical protein